MTRAEYLALSREHAKPLMIPLDFEVLTKAIDEGKPVWFKYTDRYFMFAQRRVILPVNFFETPPTSSWGGKVWLWAAHVIHGKREQYDVSRIVDVRFFPTLLEAMLDPSVDRDFWVGGAVSLETTPL